MAFKERINRFRRRFTSRLTKNIGSAYSEPERGSVKVSDITNILIVRPSHRLGNQLLLTPIVQEVINTFPDCKIDLIVKGGVAHPVFQNYNEVSRIIELPRNSFHNPFLYATRFMSIRLNRYDLVINADKNSSSGRLLTNMSSATIKIFGDMHEDIKKQYADHRHKSKYPIYNLRACLLRLGLSNEKKAIPVLNIKLDDSEIAEGKRILDKIVNDNKKTICIYTNATGNKCYSEDWWETIYSRLAKEYPDYKIFEMLPVDNISKINFKAPNFYSKDIREMGAVIRNADIFITADNGVMHLASASLTPTVGFFKGAKTYAYEPYGNGNVAIDTRKETDIDQWMATISKILKRTKPIVKETLIKS